MSRVRSKDTKPELKVRRAAHALGLRFRLHRKDLPGKPDLVFPKHKTVIFVHGCFWHRHPHCTKASQPKTRADFWNEKFAANVARDSLAEKELETLGWRVLTVWECETRNPEGIGLYLRRAFDTADEGDIH
jgi:DNA mismatch endonuclease (patch repair protein)